MLKPSIFLVIFGLILWSCNKKDPEDIIPDNYDIDFPFFPTTLNIPKDNPITVEKIKLGRYLFYDGRISGSDCSCGTNCANCHIAESSFSCVYNLGKDELHNTPSLANLVYNFNGYNWNGEYYPANPNINKRTLEDLIRDKLVADWAINSDTASTIIVLKNLSKYQGLFTDAFGDSEVTVDRICKAIASFLRSIVTTNSKYYKYLLNEESFSVAEKRGHDLFMSEKIGCYKCHGGYALLTYNNFYNIGLDSNVSYLKDRFQITGSQDDIGAYRTPSLANIEMTLPYMHDGRFMTLEEVLDFYAMGIHGVSNLPKEISRENLKLNLTKQNKNDLILFLKTFTDNEMLADERLKAPSDL